MRSARREVSRVFDIELCGRFVDSATACPQLGVCHQQTVRAGMGTQNLIRTKLTPPIALVGIWAVVVAGAVTGSVQHARAMGDAPDAPKIDCRKKKNKTKPACKKKQKSELTDE
jgi:hypothetical protein